MNSALGIVLGLASRAPLTLLAVLMFAGGYALLRRAEV